MLVPAPLARVTGRARASFRRTRRVSGGSWIVLSNQMTGRRRRGTGRLSNGGKLSTCIMSRLSCSLTEAESPMPITGWIRMWNLVGDEPV